MRSLDLAQLYLRVAIGGMLILHNIGNMQNFNEIISTYPHFDGLSNRFWFLIFSSLESASAIMLIIGWRVRVAATILIAGTILAILIYHPSPSTDTLELKAIYTFLYIYVLIAGGGTYSLDRLRNKRGATI